MIVFTIKNSRSNTVYVGTTRDSIDERWTLFQLAKDVAIEAPLYEDMRRYGVACFSIEEYDYAENRAELSQLFDEAMEQFDGVSLKGMKTTLPRTAVYPTSEGAPASTKTALAKSKATTANSKTTAAKSKVTATKSKATPATSKTTTIKSKAVLAKSKVAQTTSKTSVAKSKTVPTSSTLATTKSTATDVIPKSTLASPTVASEVIAKVPDRSVAGLASAPAIINSHTEVPFVPLKAMLANALSPLKSITAPLPAISSMTKSERILQNVRSRKVLVNSDTIIKSKTALVKPKLAIGRTGSATREKKIKEAIELEKQPRIGLKNRQIIEQADEVKSIMQTLDSRGSTLPKRY